MSALDGLPPDQRAVLELLYAHDRTPEQVAELAGVTPQAVRERAQQALVALGPERTRAYLRELEPPPVTPGPLAAAPVVPRRTVPTTLVFAACVVVALVALVLFLSTSAGR